MASALELLNQLQPEQPKTAIELFDALPDQTAQPAQPDNSIGWRSSAWNPNENSSGISIKKFASDAYGALKDYAVGAYQGGKEMMRNEAAVRNMLDREGNLRPEYTQNDLEYALGQQDNSLNAFAGETLSTPAMIGGAIVAPGIAIPAMIAPQAVSGYKNTEGDIGDKAYGAFRQATFGPFVDIATDPETDKKFQEHPARMTAETLMAFGQAVLPLEAGRRVGKSANKWADNRIAELERELSEPVQYVQTHENVGVRDPGATEINVNPFNEKNISYQKPNTGIKSAAELLDEIPITYEHATPELSAEFDNIFANTPRSAPQEVQPGKSADSIVINGVRYEKAQPAPEMNFDIREENSFPRFAIKEGVDFNIQPEAQGRVASLVKAYNREFPDDPITITDGMRPQNADYGSPTSYHKSGEAVDFVSPGLESSAENRAKFQQLAKEHGFVEVLDEYTDPSARATGGHIHVGGLGEKTYEPRPVAERSTEPTYAEPAEVMDISQQREAAWETGDLDAVADTFPNSPLVADALRKRALMKDRSALVEPPTIPPEVAAVIDEGYKAKPEYKITETRPVDAIEAEAIKQKTGLDVAGYKHEISSHEVKHTLKKHSGAAEESRGQIPITREDFNLVPEVTRPENLVGIEAGRRSKVLLYEKRVNGHLLVVEEVLVGRGSLRFLSMRKTKRSSARLDAGEPGPVSHVQDVRSLTSSNSNILPGEGNVNGKEFMAANGMTVPQNSPRPATPSGVQVPTTVSRREIVNKVNELFTKVSTGRLGKRGVLGWFDRNSEVIRTKDYADFRTIMHEIGHYLDKGLDLRSNAAFDHELINVVHRRFGKSYDHLTLEQKRGEGIAEFIHDYTTNPARAQQEFPSYYKAFEQRLAQEPQIKGKLDDVKGKLNTWHNQAAQERVKGSISFGDSRSTVQKTIDAIKDPAGTAKDVIEKGRTTFEAGYDNLIDQLAPLDRMMKEIEKVTGEKIPLAQDVFKQAWLTRGWAGKAQALIENGLPKQDIPALKNIVKSVEKDMEGFSAYVVALRELDAYKLADKTGVKYQHALSKADAARTIVEGRKNPAFVKAQQDLVKFQNNLLDILVDAGIKDRASVEAMKAKWPNYAPFFREFDEAAIQKFFGTKGFGNVSNPIKEFKGSTRDIVNPLESIIKNTYQFINLAERNKVGRLFVELAQKPGLGNIVEKVTGSATTKDSTFSVWNNGKKEVFQTTPELYRAIMLLDREPAQGIMKILSIPAGWLRAGAVLSPEFIVRNPVRDAWSAFVYSKYGFIPGIDTARGLMHLLKKDDLYWEYMNSGAAHAAMVSLDRNYLSQSIREVMSKTAVEKAVSVVNPKTYIDILRAFSEATEMATRLGAYENARTGYTGVLNRLFSDKRTVASIEEAALGSRDITLDFSRSGVWGKEANKYVAFWNATVQGADKMVRAFKDNPVGTSTKVFMSVTLPSIVLYYMNRDDQRYQELPQWQKDLFWIIPTKETLIKIPKPFEVGILFGTSVERMLQWMDNKEKGDKQAAKHAFKGFGDTVIDGMLPSWIPTAMLPIIEWTTNYSFFMDRDIVSQSQAKLPPKLQYGPNTSAIGKAVGEALNVSPSKVDNTIRGYTGGLGGLAMTASDLVTGAFDSRPKMRVSEYPGIRAFTATPYRSSQSVQDFYDRLQEQEQFYNEFKQTGATPAGFNPSELEQLRQAADAISDVHKQEKIILADKNSSPEEKRKQLDRLQMLKVNYARLGLSKQQIK